MCVFDLQAHNGSRKGEKTRSKIYTLRRPWASPALMYTATTKASECVCETERERQRKWFLQLKSMTLICASQQTLRAWCCKIQGFFLCSRRLPGAFERQFNDERQHAWMLVFCFRSRGKNRQSQNNFRSLIFLLRCHIHLERSKSHCILTLRTALEGNDPCVPIRVNIPDCQDTAVKYWYTKYQNIEIYL